MELLRTNSGNLAVKLFSDKLPKRRGSGTYSQGSLDQMNLILTKSILPWMDKNKVNPGNLSEVLEGSKRYLKEALDIKTYTTVKKEKSILSSWIAFNFPVNPKRIELELSEIKIPEMGIDKTEKSKDLVDLRTLLDSIANPKHKLFLKFAYYSGCRVSEMINLKLKDGKKSKDGQEILFSVIGKGNKERIIRTPVKMYEEILEAFLPLTTKNKKKYLFYNPRNKEGKFSRQFIFDITNTKGGISPHQLRHSRATHLVEKGVPINEVSELLGHSSIATTTKFYIHSKIKSETLREDIL